MDLKGDNHMGFWKELGKIATGGKFGKRYLNPLGLFDSEGIQNKAFHKITGTPTSKEKREQSRLVNEQIKAYQDQTEISKAALAQAKDAEQVEKRRIQEKQIRSLRRTSSARGFLGSSSDNSFSNDSGLNSTLGG